MENMLRELEQRAADRLSHPTDIDDIRSLAELSKILADARKASADGKNQSKLIRMQARQARLEGLKSWSSLLIPLVSLFTVLATILIQYFEARWKMEDAQWRDLLSSVKQTDYARDVTLAPLLVSFGESSRYKKQTRSIAIGLAGQVTDRFDFNALYSTVIARDGTPALSDLNDIARGLTRTKSKIESDCASVSAELGHHEFLGLCNFGILDQKVRENAKTQAGRVNDLRKGLLNVVWQLEFINRAIEPLIRQQFAIGATPYQHIDFSGIFVSGASFEDIDFSKFDLSHTVFNATPLKGAIIKPRRRDQMEFRTAWWEARSIDKQLLEELIERSYPCYAQGVWYGTVLNEEEYKHIVSALLRDANSELKTDTIKFKPMDANGLCR